MALCAKRFTPQFIPIALIHTVKLTISCFKRKEQQMKQAISKSIKLLALLFFKWDVSHKLNSFFYKSKQRKLWYVFLLLRVTVDTACAYCDLCPWLFWLIHFPITCHKSCFGTNLIWKPFITWSQPWHRQQVGSQELIKQHMGNAVCWLDKQRYMTDELLKDELWFHVISLDSQIHICQPIFQREKNEEQRLNKWCNEGEISGDTLRNELWKCVQLFSENKDKLSFLIDNNTLKRFISLVWLNYYAVQNPCSL